METLYWICEYGKVFCGYMLFMFLWPSVVFSRHLKNKDKIYHFSFCVLVQVVIANSVVLILGLFHILNRWVVICIFYGVFLINIVQKLNFKFKLGSFNETLVSFYRLTMGTLGIKSFLFQSVRKAIHWLKGKSLEKLHFLRLHFLEYIVLLAVVLYGMVYFSWGSLQAYGYAFSDMYVHHQWIYGLIEGEIFSGGVYPEAMHCFVYCVHTLFGIKVYSCIQLMGGIHIVVFLLSAYFLMREIFQWKFTPIFVLAVFLTLDTTVNLNFIVSMSRLQSMLPQEFGLYTQFLCALYLVRYLKSANKVRYKDRISKFYWDENLLLFMLSLADSIAIHFYTTIMAFFLCLSFAVFAIKRIFTKEYFIPLVTAVVCGVLIVVLPMGGALASGKRFQGSINWALGVMSGEKSESGTKKTKSRQYDNKSILERIQKKVSIYREGYTESYGEARADIIVAVMGLDVLVLAVYYLGMLIWQKVWKRSLKKKCFYEYFPMIFASMTFMAVEKASALGLPQLIDSPRLYSIEHILLLTVMAMPADILFTIFRIFCMESILQVLSAFAAIGIYFVTVSLGNYHGFLMEYLTRYDSTVMVTNSIIDHFPREKYTIVSPVDELYQIAQYGYHEELLTFAQEIEKRDYKLPTEYVFLFVEKKPIKYAQLRFFQGPSWLGSGKYAERYPDIIIHPDISASEISEDEVQKEILFYDRPSQSYSMIESRVILESKEYLWCQNFSKLHPFEVNVYYEDESFICYYFEQNPYALYDLAIDDWDRMDGIQW